MKKIWGIILVVMMVMGIFGGKAEADRPRQIFGDSGNIIIQNENLDLGEEADRIISNQVTSLSFDEGEGALWVGTLRGLSKLDLSSGKWTSWTYENGIPSNAVYAVKARSNGEDWVGTDEALAKFKEEKWISFDERQGFPEHRTLAMTEDLNGNMWFGTNDGLWEFSSEERWRFFRAGEGNSPLRDANVSAVTVDKNGVLWIGGSELYSLVPSDQLGKLGDWSRYEWEPGLAKVITSLAVDNEGAVWIGTNRGVLVFNGGFWTEKYGESVGLAADAVNAILIDKANNKWFGTDEGLSRLSFDGEWKTFKEEDTGLIDNRVMALESDAEGEIWVGTMGGVSHFDGITWENYRTDGKQFFDPTEAAEEEENTERNEFLQEFTENDLAGHWARDYFVDLVRQGIISGFEDGSFKPDNLVTRGELLKMALGAAGIRAKKFTTYDIPFTDVIKTSWVAQYLKAALDAGVLSETSGNWRPNEPATRKEAAILITDAFDLEDGDGEALDFYDVPSSHQASTAVRKLANNGIISGTMEDVDVVLDEFDAKDRYDFRLARDLGQLLADLGYFGQDEVNDYYTRALFNALSAYQKDHVYQYWNWFFGYPDEETRNVLGQTHVKKTELQTKRMFHPEANITRAETAKILKVLMDKN